MAQPTATTKKSSHFLAIAAILLVVSTLICYLIASSGGSTKIQRMTVPGENSLSMSYELWTPKEASTENKLPLCIVCPAVPPTPISWMRGRWSFPAMAMSLLPWTGTEMAKPML